MASSQYSPQPQRGSGDSHSTESLSSAATSGVSPTSAPIPGYSDDEARDIYARAAEIQSHADFADNKLTPEQLQRSANRAGISDAAVEQAIKEREQDRLKAAQAEKQRAAQKAQLTKKLSIGGAVAASLLGLTLLTANSTLGKRQQAVLAAQSQIENVQQRRYDLVPNLIKVTKSTLQNQGALINSLQTAADAAKNAAPQAQGAAQANLTAVIEQTMEALQRDNAASPAVSKLNEALEGSENRIAQERRKLGQAVESYNRAASSFPIGWAGRMLGYRANYPYFQANEKVREAVKY